ncbi:hypothetical protein BsWGS_03470 [Bradybaena similaris]
MVTPTFDKTPDLKLEIENATSAVKLLCSFPALKQQQAEVYIYTVTWYRNLQKLRSHTLNNQTTAILQDRELGVLNYADQISCGVSACIYGDCNNTQGPERLSAVLVAELTIQETKVTVTEGEGSSPLTIRSRLPPRVFCASNVSTSDCVFIISTLFLHSNKELKCLDGYIVPQVVLVWDSATHNSSTCGVTITSLNWLSGVTISVQAGVDGLKDNTQRRSLQINVTLRIMSVTQWTRNVNIVEVEVKDRDVTAECKIVGDPHITTFDSCCL